VDAGDTFLRTDNDRHLWIVLSDPAVDPDTVLLVNLTTYDSRKERACILLPGDHEWVRKETCVNYQDAVVLRHVSDDGLSRTVLQTVRTVCKTVLHLNSRVTEQ
jgi:hypothetical protein